tara:strand:- start:53 stop:331 length:279 start_codon:yes stop_codon:yes gene_type:complete
VNVSGEPCKKNFIERNIDKKDTDDINVISKNLFLSSFSIKKISHIINSGNANKINDSLLRAAIINKGNMYQYFFKAKDINIRVDNKNSALSG